jgi:hypothetical protein
MNNEIPRSARNDTLRGIRHYLCRRVWVLQGRRALPRSDGSVDVGTPIDILPGPWMQEGPRIAPLPPGRDPTHRVSSSASLRGESFSDNCEGSPRRPQEVPTKSKPRVRPDDARQRERTTRTDNESGRRERETRQGEDSPRQPLSSLLSPTDFPVLSGQIDPVPVPQVSGRRGPHGRLRPLHRQKGETTR